MELDISSIISRLYHRRFIRFFFVSGVATVLNFAVFYAMHKLFFIDYRVASGVGFFCGVILGYFLNSRWTFRSTDADNPKRQFFKYYIVYLFSLAVNLVMMDVLVEYVGIYPSLANIMTIGFTFVSNYLGTRFWVFKKPRLS